MVPEQNYEETDRLEMLLLGQDVLSDFFWTLGRPNSKPVPCVERFQM